MNQPTENTRKISDTRVFEISFSQLEKTDAANIVRLCAFLYRENIPEEILKQGIRELGGIFEPLSDQVVLDNALAKASESRFLQYNPYSQIFVIDSLTQDFLKQGLSDSEQRAYAELAVRAVNHVFPDEIDYSKNREQIRRLMSCARACVRLIEQWDLVFEEAAHFLDKMGRHRYERGDEADAESLLERALAMREKLLDKDNLYVAESLTHLARASHAQSKYESAKPLYERALAIREKVLGKMHTEVAESLNNLGSLFHAQGEYAQAKPFYEQALQIFERVQGRWHPDVANTLTHLASLYSEQDEYEQAKPLYERALQILEQAYGKTYLEIVPALNHLASFYEAQGKYAHAHPYYKRALDILENALGKRDPEVATGLNNVARLYEKQGVYDYAESLYQQAMTVLEKAFGWTYPDITDSLNNLAVLHEKQGHYAQAKSWYEKVLNRLTEFEPDNPDIQKFSEKCAFLVSKINDKADQGVVDKTLSPV